MLFLQLNFKREDSSHRIKSLNILLDLSEVLEKRLRDMKKLVDGDCVGKEVMEGLVKLLNDTCKDFQQKQLLPKSDFSNLLDKKMQELRSLEFKSVISSLQSASKEIRKGRYSKDKPLSKEQKEQISSIIESISSFKKSCIEVHFCNNGRS